MWGKQRPPATRNQTKDLLLEPPVLWPLTYDPQTMTIPLNLLNMYSQAVLFITVTPWQNSPISCSLFRLEQLHQEGNHAKWFLFQFSFFCFDSVQLYIEIPSKGWTSGPTGETLRIYFSSLPSLHICTFFLWVTLYSPFIYVIVITRCKEFDSKQIQSEGVNEICVFQP